MKKIIEKTKLSIMIKFFLRKTFLASCLLIEVADDWICYFFNLCVHMFIKHILIKVVPPSG